ncbi:DUF2487 family protein [Paenibacillus rigui]|uniref:DUF2487 domain-containing protein n=1 Tax=Paenibacillus rigui TaxID=554312 RepID=A0A229UYL4_9BACL|nr:DUF2487 family protein [Paenibacillus rigui]OXM88049.1 hypothetical protein CF651_02850 [Paenibacillus rigui]
MKFSDVEASSWEELQPYVDTCLLPVTGLTGDEQPWEATKCLEDLRDALDLLEIPYKGRVLTYPAFHYVPADTGMPQLQQICKKLKSSFRYVVLVSAQQGAASQMDSADADAAFVITPEILKEAKAAVQSNIAEKLQQIWAGR